MRFTRSKGFTLAELLIALAILGVIATFTIPKVLQSTNSSQNESIAKEAASMVSGAFASFQLDNSLASTVTAANLTQFMNYVALDTATTSNNFALPCTATNRCLILHNGGVLQYGNANSFGGTGTTNAVFFNLDPDGGGTADDATFVQYYNGRLTTYGRADAGTATAGGPTASGTLGTSTSDPTYIQDWGD